MYPKMRQSKLSFIFDLKQYYSLQISGGRMFVTQSRVLLFFPKRGLLVVQAVVQDHPGPIVYNLLSYSTCRSFIVYGMGD